MDIEKDPRQTQPYWVVYRYARLFVAGHETQEAAEADAARLNQLIPAPPGEPLYYLVIPRPQDMP